MPVIETSSGRRYRDARRERDYVQGVAWLRLASAGGLRQATELAAGESTKLTPDQAKWMEDLKRDLVRH